MRCLTTGHSTVGWHEICNADQLRGNRKMLLDKSEALPLALNTMTTDRARRALSHGGGIDSILFLLLAAAGVGMIVLLIMAGLQTAEASATRDAGTSPRNMNTKSAEIGNL